MRNLYCHSDAAVDWDVLMDSIADMLPIAALRGPKTLVIAHAAKDWFNLFVDNAFLPQVP